MIDRVVGAWFVFAISVVIYLWLCDVATMHAHQKLGEYNVYFYAQLDAKNFCESDRALAAGQAVLDDEGFDLPRMIKNWNRNYLEEQPGCPAIKR